MEGRWHAWGVGGVRAAAVNDDCKTCGIYTQRLLGISSQSGTFRWQEVPNEGPEKCSQGDVSYCDKLPKIYCGKSPRKCCGKLPI